MPLVEAPTGHVVRSHANSASSSTTVLPLDDDQALVGNFIAGNLVGVDFRKAARP